MNTFLTTSVGSSEALISLRDVVVSSGFPNIGVSSPTI